MLRETYLVQRMKAPLPSTEPVLSSGARLHHVFGGAQLGLPKEAWDILDRICTLDYMGAAEYEAWGGPSKVQLGFGALAEQAAEKQLRTFAFSLGPHERALNPSREWAYKSRSSFPPAQFVVLYGICHESLVSEVTERVRALAATPSRFHVKRGTQIERALDPVDKYDFGDPVQGWLELDNGFLFFSNRKMWEGFCDLFEVEKCEAPPAPETVDYSKMSKKQLVQVAMSLGMFINKTAANEVKKVELVKQLTEAQEAAHGAIAS